MSTEAAILIRVPDLSLPVNISARLLTSSFSPFLSSQTFGIKSLQMSTTKTQSADGSMPDGLAITFLAGRKDVPFRVSLSIRFLGNPEERG